MNIRHSFTLIEVLAVVGIISLLAVIGFGTYTLASNSAKEKSTTALVKRLDTAFESCRTKLGYYPASATYLPLGVTYTNGIITQLTVGGTAVQADYLAEFIKIVEPASLQKFINSSSEIEDSWGTTLYYKFPNGQNKTRPDIISAGPNGKFGYDDQPASSVNNVDYTSGACDDITNF